jgi:HD-GYP domain-containing protein (c-di-GMP phosphodiesterase class II)
MDRSSVTGWQPIQEPMANVATPRAGLDPALEEAIGDLRARRPKSLAARERFSAFALGGGFLATALASLALFQGSDRSPDALVVVLLVVAYGTAFRLDFEVATGFAVPTQLVLVPMLFIAPLAWVPAMVAGGILVGGAIDYARGAIHAERVFLSLVNGWYVFGPVLVLGLAEEGRPSLASMPLYLGALAAQFAFDFASAAAHEWLTLGVRPEIQLRAMSLVWLVDAALSSVGLAVAFASVNNAYGFLLALPLVILLSVFARERRLHIDNALELSSAYRGTAFLLGDVVEADDAYTGSHSRDVVDLSLAVADELGLDARKRRATEFVALLHDVGKVRIPKEIINKPGALTDEERAIINTHTIEGEHMLKKVGGLLGEIGAIVRSCHERWDGGGYPDGLTGEDIPLIARIVACCDAFNAMTTDRPYRAALPLDEALAELERGSGGQFDPAVVEALARSLRGKP